MGLDAGSNPRFGSPERGVKMESPWSASSIACRRHLATRHGDALASGEPNRDVAVTKRRDPSGARSGLSGKADTAGNPAVLSGWAAGIRTPTT